MTKREVTKSVVEQAALAWLESIGWILRNGTGIATGEPTLERSGYSQVVLEPWLRDALVRSCVERPEKHEGLALKPGLVRT